MGRLARISSFAVLLFLIYPVMIHCQDSTVQVTVTEDDAREITGYLRELKSARLEVQALQKIIERDQEQDAKEKEFESARLKFAEEQRDFYKNQVEVYQKQLEQMTKGGGIGCTLKKVFTIGIAKCH